MCCLNGFCWNKFSCGFEKLKWKPLTPLWPWIEWILQNQVSAGNVNPTMFKLILYWPNVQVCGKAGVHFHLKVACHRFYKTHLFILNWSFLVYPQKIDVRVSILVTPRTQPSFPHGESPCRPLSGMGSVVILLWRHRKGKPSCSPSLDIRTYWVQIAYNWPFEGT